MKKVVIRVLSLLLIVVIFVGLYIAQEYKGDSYFALINQKATQVETVYDNQGNPQDKAYNYTLDAFDEEGHKESLSFKSFGKPLTQNKYLIIQYNERKGVLNWHEIQPQAIPKKILKQLN